MMGYIIFSRFPLPPLKATGDEADIMPASHKLSRYNLKVRVIAN